MAKKKNTKAVKRSGSKRPDHDSYIERNRKLRGDEFDQTRFDAQVEIMDVFTVAMGRYGRRHHWTYKALHDFFAEIDKEMDSVMKEFHHELVEEYLSTKVGSHYKGTIFDDPIMMFKQHVDEEMKLYTGDLFVPWEERYDVQWHTFGLRVKRRSGGRLDSLVEEEANDDQGL